MGRRVRMDSLEGQTKESHSTEPKVCVRNACLPYGCRGIKCDGSDVPFGELELCSGFAKAQCNSYLAIVRQLLGACGPLHVLDSAQRGVTVSAEKKTIQAAALFVFKSVF